VGDLAEALKRLSGAGRCPPQMVGLLAVLDGVRYRLGDDGRWREALGPRSVPGLLEADSFVLDDPATVGCLLALYREAVGDRLASVEPAAVFQGDDYTGPWTTVRWDGNGWVHGPDAPTEGEALAAALVDLAARVSP
jgi:hypothetical protein